MTPEVLAFLREYAAWLDSGAPKGKPFWRDMGLCGNATKLLESSYLTFAGIFTAQGMDRNYPFNSSIRQFIREECEGTCHLNHARVAWVRRMIEENEKP